MKILYRFRESGFVTAAGTSIMAKADYEQEPYSIICFAKSYKGVTSIYIRPD